MTAAFTVSKFCDCPEAFTSADHGRCESCGHGSDWHDAAGGCAAVVPA